LSELRVVQALVGVARMVVALHAAGYVHRNIKPQNVLRHMKKHEWIISDYAYTAPIGALPFMSPHRLSISILPPATATIISGLVE
jgi:serine/threonine protein kinase